MKSFGCTTYKKETPYNNMRILNKKLYNIRNEQNKKYHISNAEDSEIKSVSRLHEKISLNHDKILSEVKSLMSSGYTGYPMAYMDKEQEYLTSGKTLWSPIWVKFIDTWAGTADSLPTLKKIVSEVDDILLLHVSVFKPGTVLPIHNGISMGVWRYHYGLSIPDGDVGINIDNKYIKWKNREGFIWDDTVPHSAWNLTNETRLVIFADIYREISDTESTSTKITKEKIVNAHINLQKMKHVKSISSRLKSQGPNKI
jgi:hypothetical protein